MGDKKLLLIDSNREHGQALVDGFSELPLVEVRWAKSADEGKQAAKEFNPDAVLIDLHLPDANGFALFGTFKRSMAMKNRIYVITASEEDRKSIDQHRKLRKHAERYLIKPFGADDLYKALTNLLTLPQLGVSNEEPQSQQQAPQVVGVPVVDEGGDDEVLNELDSLLGDIPDGEFDSLVEEKEADLSELDQMLGVEEVFEEEVEDELAPVANPENKEALQAEAPQVEEPEKEISDIPLESEPEMESEELQEADLVENGGKQNQAIEEALADALENDQSLEEIVDSALQDAAQIDNGFDEAKLENSARDAIASGDREMVKETLEIAEALRDELAGKEKSIERLNSDLDAAIARFREAEEALTEEKEELALVRRQIAQTEEKLTESDVEKSRLKEQLTRKEEEVSSIGENLSSKDAEIGSLRSELDVANAQLAQLEERFHVERSTKEDLALENAEKYRVVEENAEKLASEVEELSGKLKNAEDDVLMRDKEINDLKAVLSENRGLADELETGRLTNEKLTAMLEDLKSEHEKTIQKLEEEHAGELTNIRRSGDDKISELNRELNSLGREKEELMAARVALKEELDQLRQQYELAGKSSQDAGVQVGLLEAELEELRETNKLNEQRVIRAYGRIKTDMELRVRLDKALHEALRLIKTTEE